MVSSSRRGVVGISCRGNVHRWLKPACEKAGVGWAGPHSFRHTCGGVIALKAGAAATRQHHDTDLRSRTVRAVAAAQQLLTTELDPVHVPVVNLEAAQKWQADKWALISPLIVDLRAVKLEQSHAEVAALCTSSQGCFSRR
jgi:integrase